MCDPGEFVFVGDGEHDVETEGAVQQDGLDFAFVKLQQEVGGNRKCSEFMWSLCWDHIWISVLMC